MSLTIQSGGSITLQGGAGGGAISAVNSSQAAGPAVVTGSTYADLSPSVSVTATTGSQVLITVGSDFSRTNGSGLSACRVSVRVSGATIRSATGDGVACGVDANFVGGEYSNQFVMSGLTAGINTFTLVAKTGAGTWELYNPRLIVQTLA